MRRSCRKLRDGLAAGAVAPDGPGARHLSQCDGCARFAERLRVARGLLREHHAEVEPDARFTARVLARLDGEPVSPLGWAAVRVLPATLALLLVLAWLSWSVAPEGTAAEAAVSPTEDLLTWVLEPGEGS